jgi:hypothetical protein
LGAAVDQDNPPTSTPNAEFVSSIEATGQEVVGTQPYGMLTAIFTRTTTPPAVQRPPAKPPRGPRLPNPGRVNEKAAK